MLNNQHLVFVGRRNDREHIFRSQFFFLAGRQIQRLKVESRGLAIKKLIVHFSCRVDFQLLCSGNQRDLPGHIHRIHAQSTPSTRRTLSKTDDVDGIRVEPREIIEISERVQVYGLIRIVHARQIITEVVDVKS
ncbi:hypothetical protein SDC9_207647 [bioreactor metagenome]|uniref:Uncharacterized protein n=1 Tax=bioreactor metagenome TaxID=1076179 RepID=A0A645JHV1_9ZZZZ